jgi:hypothetical protein
MPRLRFGHIDPAAVEARRARRGPGYEFYQIVPTNIMLVTAVLGIKDFTRDAVEAAIPNYWNCVEALAEEKSTCLFWRNSGIRAAGMSSGCATVKKRRKNRHSWRAAGSGLRR